MQREAFFFFSLKANKRMTAVRTGFLPWWNP